MILVSLCLFNPDVLAQKKQKGFFSKSKSKKDRIENVDSIKLVADSLHRELLRRDSIVSVNAKLIDSIRRNAKQDSLRFSVAAKHQQDSLLNVIRNKDKEITKLKANAGFVDTCMVKLANHWLYERFDKSDVDEAIKYFDRIYSSRFKEDMSIVQDLLRNYECSYREFQAILKQAQRDIDRESPFAYEEYKDKYISIIENMLYYTRFYNGELNIAYLNKQISKALEILKNHSNNKFADFSLLIDPNFE